MSFHFADIARHAATDNAVSETEILELRRAGWADGRMTRDEAEAIFAAQSAIAVPTREWSDFFVEAIQQFVLNSEPRGYASEADAVWLIEQVSRDGRVCSMTELELLTRVIEKAVNVPQSLKTFVLAALEEAVLTGTGPTRNGGELAATHVTEAECMLIRRVIFGSGGDGPAAVSQREAEMLFRIKDASLEKNNPPEFKRLFVQAVGNYLQGYAANGGQLSRERAAELEAFIADHSTSVGRFMGRMAVGAPNAFGKVFGRRKEPVRDRIAEMDAAAEVTGSEHAWLNVQLNANGKIDDYDRALLHFLAEERG